MDPERRLRELNRYDPGKMEISPELAQRALTPPPGRRRWTLPVRTGLALAPVAAALAVVILLIAGADSRGDLAGKAYAAVTGDVVFHWRTQTTSPGGARQVTAGWSYKSELHLVGYDVIDGRPVLTSDRRTASGRQLVWSRASGDTTSQPAAPPTRTPSPLADGDPVQAFRAAYQAGAVTEVDDHTVRVPLGADYNGRPAFVTYTFNPDTGLPTRLTVLNQEVTFEAYERLDPSTANVARLQLLPGHELHTGADDPSALFAALRRPDTLTSAERTRLTALAEKLDADNAINARGIRSLSQGVWLLPGRRHICIAVAAPGEPTSITSSCVTTAKARKSGIPNQSSGQTTIAVPDGTSAVQITTDRGTRTVPVTDGLVRVRGSLQRYTLR